MAGRLTLAVVLSAQEDSDTTCETNAIHALEACLLLLDHFAAAFPTSLGAAETLKETTRVCEVHLPKAALTSSGHGRFAWHRPLPRKSTAAAGSSGGKGARPPVVEETGSRPPNRQQQYTGASTLAGQPRCACTPLSSSRHDPVAAHS